MKVEALIFSIIGVFCVVAAVVYGLWSQEAIGTTALVLSAGLLLLIGGFFWFVSRRIDARPEDRKDAEIAEGAGELGFFSPGSYWPITVAGGVALTGFGLAFYQWWLIVLGAIFLIIAVCGLVFEYHAGPEAH